MKKYFIVWTYGQHFATIETDKEDFEKIINCLSDEFKIHKKKEYIEKIRNLTILHIIFIIIMAIRK